MTVVFGKKNCGLCEAAKQKLSILGVEYRFVDMEEPHPSDWRQINMAGAMAEYQFTETLPWLALDGQILSYPAAMKALRSATGR